MRISRSLLIMVAALFSLTNWANQGSESATLESAQIAYIRLTDSIWQIWTMSADGTQHQQWTDDYYDFTRLSWGPKGESILANRSDGTLHQLNLSDGKIQQLNITGTGIYDAQWSPDGLWIVFSRISTSVPDNNNLWRVHPDGSELQKLTNQPELQILPTWGPDSNKVAYSAGKAIHQHEIYTLDVKSGSVSQISNGQGYHYDPAYSSNNDLAYSANISGNYDIWFQSGGSGESRQLTTNTAFDGEPSWSPDAKFIAFTSFRGGHKRIWTTNLETGSIIALTPEDSDSRSPAWRHSK